MNTCLMVKWIDRLPRGDDSLCCSLLRRKYQGQRSIFQIKTKKGSQFWRSLLDLRPWYKKGRVIKIKAGHQTRFWLDCWLGDCPLKIKFHNLYNIASDPDLTVANAYVNGQWRLTFRRQLNERLSQEWSDLQDLLRGVNLSEESDRVLWALERSHKYSTKSLYNAMTMGGVIDTRMMVVWKCPIPLKVKIFVWMVAHDRISVKEKEVDRPREMFGLRCS